MRNWLVLIPCLLATFTAQPYRAQAKEDRAVIVVASPVITMLENFFMVLPGPERREWFNVARRADLAGG